MQETTCSEQICDFLNTVIYNRINKKQQNLSEGIKELTTHIKGILQKKINDIKE